MYLTVLQGAGCVRKIKIQKKYIRQYANIFLIYLLHPDILYI